MSYELTIIPGTQIALFCWSGPVSHADRKNNVVEIARFCGENGIRQIIVDTRQAVSKTTMMETFELGSSVARSMSGVQFAIVRQSSDENAQFFEFVAANRGAHSRSFGAIEDALRWLNAK